MRSTQTEGVARRVGRLITCAGRWGLSMKADPVTRVRAKRLRRELTDAERIVWSRIKEGKLRGWHFRCQHPVGPYILDFACVKLKLAVEIDGATHSTLPERLHDERRARYLAREGWVTVRFWNDEVYRSLHGVVESILARLPEARVRAARARRVGRAGPLRQARKSAPATSPSPSD